MHNPISKLVPQLFGDYPKNFERLYKAISVNKKKSNDSIKVELWKAYEFGQNKHSGQKRKSGEPYFNHCMAVAKTLAEWNMDITTIIAGLLHDTIEDTNVTIEDLKLQFGEDVSELVNGLSKIKDIEFSTRRQRQAENFMKLLLSVAKDLRVIIIKFADRLHNMETIKYMSQIKQHRIAVETRDVYAPLAHRLGMSSVKSKLDDLVLKTLQPDIFKQIDKNIRSTQKTRSKIIKTVIDPIKKEFESYKIKPKIYGRSKSYASIHGKMISRNREFEDIYDLYAIRIVVSKIEECYLSLGLVHSLFKPIQERFKDFIATPKSNGYQSVHTTIIVPNGNRVEIQIRTEEMEKTAEIGVAAHWLYKEGNSIQLNIDIKWLRDLLDILQNDSIDHKDFMDLLKIDLFNDEIFVFTPAGDLIQLPIGATPVDFAFRVHTQIGMHCMGAKVNHITVPLNTKLNSGDLIEIITGKNQMPSYGWQKYIVTTKARTHVDRFLRTLREKESIKLGLELLEKTLRRMKMIKELKEFKNSFEIFGFPNQDILLKEIGIGNLTVRDMIAKLRPQSPVDHPKDRKTNKIFNISKSKPSNIVLNGIDNVMVNFGKCCNPIPGDDLIGFVTRGRGITVHIVSCKSLPLLSHETDRLVPVEWNVKRAEYFSVQLKITGQDYKGWLKDISECISNQNINITSVDTKVKDFVSTAVFMVQLNNIRQLKRLIRKITKLKKVDFVERLGR